MKKKRFNKKRLFIFFLVLFMSIGFAYLSSSLNINGIFDFASSTWDVHFENIQIINNDIDASIPTLDSNKTTLKFNGNFSEPSEVFEFSVDVVNKGTINAMVKDIIRTGITSENEDYLGFTVTYYDGSEIKALDLLKASTRTRVKVRVEYKYDVESLATLDKQNFSLTLNYVSATKEAIDRKNDFQQSENSRMITLAKAKKNSMFDLKIYGNTIPLSNEKNLISLPSYGNWWDGAGVIENNNLITLNPSSYNGASTSWWSGFQYIFIPKDTTLVFSREHFEGNIWERGTFPITLDLFYIDNTRGSFTLGDTTIYNYNNVLSRKIKLGKDVCAIQITGLAYGIRGLYNPITFRVQLEKGDNRTDFEEHNVTSPDNPQEIKTVTGNSVLKIENPDEADSTKEYAVDLGKIELNSLFVFNDLEDTWSYNYRRDYIHNIENEWYLHQEVGKYMITGDETFTSSVNGDILEVTIKDLSLPKNNTFSFMLSNRFRWAKKSKLIENCFAFDINSKVLTLKMNKNITGESIDEIKEYFKNNPTYFYYGMSSAKEIKIQDENLINELNLILNNNLFEGKNIVSINSNVDTSINFNYKK